jgi:phosphatidylglycerophosphatase A
MNLETDPAPSAQAQRKPRIAYLIATSLGLGYLRPAPGTWGSLAGVVLYFLFGRVELGSDLIPSKIHQILPGYALILVALVVAAVGTWSADRVSRHAARKDPQFVVIDEVSGQSFTYLFAMAPANWKYLLLGFILFRGFDIWKPFPVRQLESLPGGWGIMADDWGAAVYAAAGLWIARALGL